MNYPFLQGGGEMAERTRNHDWAANPLGVPDGWPQSLRTSLSILLNSKLPMLLFWGRDLICFYNDAFRPSLGNTGKHPALLGMPGAEGWAEIWSIIKPLIDSVLQGGEATWGEDQLIPIYRNDQIEDVYWTFSYSPVRDEADQIRGVFVTCMETTNAVKNRLRVEGSQQELLALFEESPVGIATLSADEELIFHSANSFYADMVGRQPEALIGKPLLEALPELKGQGFDKLLKKVISTREAYKASEVSVNLFRKGVIETIYVDLIYQPRITSEGKVVGVLVVATDVTQQVRARKKVEESEENLRTIILGATVGICLVDADTLVNEIVNDRFVEVSGKRYEEVAGRKHWDTFAEAKAYYADAMQGVIDNGKPFFANEVKLMLIRQGKEEWVYVTFMYHPMKNSKGKVEKVVVYTHENTDQVLARQKVEELVQIRTKELAMANEKMLQANQELQRSNNNLEEFAHAASHDLKEPIRKIHFFTQQVKDKIQEQLTENALGFQPH